MVMPQTSNSARKFFVVSSPLGRAGYVLTTLKAILVGIAPVFIFTTIWAVLRLAHFNAPILNGFIGLFITVGLLVGIPLMCYFYILATLYRLDDIQWSRWLTILLFVPVTGLVLYLVLVFKRGITAPSKYDLPLALAYTALNVVLFWITLAFSPPIAPANFQSTATVATTTLKT